MSEDKSKDAQKKDAPENTGKDAGADARKKGQAQTRNTAADNNAAKSKAADSKDPGSAGGKTGSGATGGDKAADQSAGKSAPKATQKSRDQSQLSPDADATAARARAQAKRPERSGSSAGQRPQRSEPAAAKGAASGASTGRPAPTPRTNGPAYINPSDPGGGGSSGGGGGGILGLLALIIAVVAILISGWLWYRGEQRMASLGSRLDTVEQGMQKSVQDVVMPRLSKFDQRLKSLAGSSQQRAKKQDQKLSSLQQSLNSLQQDLRASQTRNAQLAERLDSSGKRWSLRQIESLLQAANQRLQLYNDPQGAKQALSLASDAISKQGDPRLFGVRKDIVNEIAALDALPNPDIEGLSLKLSAMLDQVPKLPIASDVPTEYSNKASANNGEGGSGEDSSLDFSRGWNHFVASVKKALSSLVTIRRENGTQNALMPPDQAFFLTQNLELELRSARLALLKRDTESYRKSLAQANKWLTQYYDTGSSQVSSMQKQLKQMRNVKLDWDAPDISASLSDLRDQLAKRSRSGGQDGNDSSAGTQSRAGDNTGEDAR